jgi:hypothetical protein
MVNAKNGDDLARIRGSNDKSTADENNKGVQNLAKVFLRPVTSRPYLHARNAVSNPANKPRFLNDEKLMLKRNQSNIAPITLTFAIRVKNRLLFSFSFFFSTVSSSTIRENKRISHGVESVGRSITNITRNFSI